MPFDCLLDPLDTKHALAAAGSTGRLAKAEEVGVSRAVAVGDEHDAQTLLARAAVDASLEVMPVLAILGSGRRIVGLEYALHLVERLAIDDGLVLARVIDASITDVSLID